MTLKQQKDVQEFVVNLVTPYCVAQTNTESSHVPISVSFDFDAEMSTFIHRIPSSEVIEVFKVASRINAYLA
jgi:hypothetical protein